MTGRDDRSKIEAMADLVNTPTGRPVVFDRVQIYDVEILAKLTHELIGLASVHGPDGVDRLVSGWEQENGSLHIMIARAREGSPSGHLMVPKGKWRELDESEYASIHRELNAGEESDAYQQLVENVADEIGAQARLRSQRQIGIDFCAGVVVVIDRSMDGLTLAGKIAEDVPAMRALLDDWLDLGRPFGLIHFDETGAHRTVQGFDGLDALLDSGLTGIAERQGGLSRCISVSSLTDSAAQKLSEAWERHGGNTLDGLADDPFPAEETPSVRQFSDDYPGVKAVIEIDRLWIEQGDIAPMEVLFAQLESPDSIELMGGSILFVVDGYNDDERMLCEIPEVRSYARRLHTKHPSWFYFMYRDSIEFNLWIGVLTEAQVLRQVAFNLAQFRYDPEKVFNLFEEVVQGTSEFFERQGWPPGDKRSDEAAADIGRLFVELAKHPRSEKT